MVPSPGLEPDHPVNSWMHGAADLTLQSMEFGIEEYLPRPRRCSEAGQFVALLLRQTRMQYFLLRSTYLSDECSACPSRMPPHAASAASAPSATRSDLMAATNSSTIAFHTLPATRACVA